MVKSREPLKSFSRGSSLGLHTARGGVMLHFCVHLKNLPLIRQSVVKMNLHGLVWLIYFSTRSLKSLKEQEGEDVPAIISVLLISEVSRLSSHVKWTRSSKTPHQSDDNVLQFEDGYLVENAVEGNELGIVPYVVRVSQDGELFAVDAENSNIVRIIPHYRSIAGQDWWQDNFWVAQGM